jgi:NADP-dependent 3-hydroxy acid dehydrogenase YdfG
MNKIALITGATSGIGKATAEILAKNNYKLVLCGRRQDRLDELKTALSEFTSVHTLQFDVRDKEAVFAQISSLPNDFSEIDILINNAGNAHGLDPIQTGSLDDWDAMIDTNIKGLLYVTRNVLPLMKNNDSGHIINIGSIAGKEVYANGNVYCATKHAVDALNKAMRLELSKFPIKVTAIHPGAVETEFSVVRFHGDKERAAKVYEGFENLVADDIADAIWYAISRPAHVNINELTIMPTAQPMAGVIHRKN